MKDITKEKLYLIIPIVLLVAIAVIIYLYFVHSPVASNSKSRLPQISAPELLHPDQRFTNSTVLNNSNGSLVVFWNASCEGCLNQHKLLLYIASTRLIPIYGIDSHDSLQIARHYIAEYGDPYKAIALDQSGTVGLLFDIQALPTSFLVDKKGIVRDEVFGVITPVIWFHRLEPEIEKLEKK